MTATSCPPVSSAAPILQRLVIEDLHGLGVALKHTGDAHVTRGIELLDAGDQARSLGLDGHVAVLEHTLDGQGVAILGDVGSVGEPPQKGAGQMLEGNDMATCEKLAGILLEKHII